MKPRNKIFIKKASGETVEFSEQKLRNSLARSGASEEQANTIIRDLAAKLYNGISTKKIYRIAFNLLKGESKPIAAKYHLKRAIMELGPSGFPFERYIGEILKHQGYETRVGMIVEGHCVKHEIDVIAEKENQHFMIECKFHNQQGTVSDVKTPLYIQARFKDVEASWIKLPGHSGKVHQGWVVTNTRFTDDAIQYGTCIGLKLIGWDYPDGESLRSRIDTLGLYPITCLVTLSKIEKQKLLDKKIVLCKEIDHNKDLLLSIGINSSRIKGVIEEVSRLCEHLNGKHT
ncbi:MAG: restriction endonuclease, partial [Bacteroidia bacterium]